MLRVKINNFCLSSFLKVFLDKGFKKLKQFLFVI